MDTDSEKDNTGMALTNNVISFFCFMVTAYYILKISKPSQDAPILKPSPGRPQLTSQETLRIKDVSVGDQSENGATEREGSEGEKVEVKYDRRKESLFVKKRKTDELFLSESEESGATDLSEQEEGEQEAKSRSSRSRSRIPATVNNPTSPVRSKKERVINSPRRPTPGLLIYHTFHYVPFDAVLQNQGAAVDVPFRHFGQFDGYALNINPNLKDTELEQIPHSGVRVDDLTASKVLSHYGRKILRTRWPAEFDQQGMIRATRVPLGRAAKRWVNRGQKDVDGKLVEQAGWYYLSWGGIHTLMGKEGLGADRYWIRPSFERFKCPGLGFKVADWAEVQLAPEDPADPTFL